MPDVMDVLKNLPDAVPTGRSGPDVVAADVARGHRAVTRRRWQRFGVTGAVAVVAAAAVGVGAGQFSPAPSSPARVVAAPAAPRLELVAYQGNQPVGFEVTTVPENWKVISSDTSSFLVAPPGADIAAPKPGEAVSLEGQIAVSLQGLSKFPAESPVKKVDINGADGRLGFPLEEEGKLSDTRWLFFPDNAGHSVQVQVPASVGLSDDQIVSFAKGITVTAQAQSIGG
ncbi:hypothetical protein GCM10010435_05130 [Winogradskya consettensis]|uniref:Uncharacterized protein n=1 Tax=Winogradskya consettensis TaxID=113560 RepID=A0A919SVU6_9ACTN|nr:hypothetical protein [Actinoplanes consettensis]GIM79576.1 hypothetical protein Aco04nite_66240 [Actinoplanes consettensis]